MQFLEKDLETLIFYTDNELLKQRGLGIHGRKKRQLRIGNYGVADLVTYYTFYDELIITVYELKQNEINSDTFLQVLRYAKGIEHYIKTIRGKEFQLTINMVMVGKYHKKDDSIYLPDLFDNVKIFTYSYEIDGLFFKRQSNYSLTNHGLNG